MITTTSFSNTKTYFKSLFKRNRALLIITSLVYFLVIMLPSIFNMVERMQYGWSNNITAYGGYFEEGHSIAVHVISAFIIFILALINNSYMHSKKNVDFYHSLPIKRTTLLHTNFVLSLATVFIPYIAVHLLTFLLNIPDGVTQTFTHYMAFMLVDFILMLINLSAIYAFTVFICVHLGTIFDTLAITAVSGFSVIALYASLKGFWTLLTYGAAESYNNLLVLSPFTFMYQYFLDNREIRSLMFVILFGAVYLVVFYGLALRSYNKRKSEMAEQSNYNGLFPVYTKMLAAFFGAASFYLMFGGGDSMGFGRLSLSGIIFSLLGAVIAGVITEIILSRGIKHLRRTFKYFLITAAAFNIIIIAMSLDIIGFEKYIPDTSEVEGVSLSYRGRFGQTEEVYWNSWYNYNVYGKELIDITGNLDKYKSEDIIKLTNEAHSIIVANKDSKENLNYWNYINITYKLKNGRTVAREYPYGYFISDSGTGRSISQILAEIESTEEFLRSNCNLFIYEDYPMEKAVFEFQDSYMTLKQYIKADDTEAAELINAIKLDMLGQSLQSITAPKEAALGVITVSRSDGIRPSDLDAERYGYYYDENTYAVNVTSNVVITPDFTNTISVLNKMGQGGLLKNELDFDSADIIGIESNNGRTVLGNIFNHYGTGIVTITQPVYYSRDLIDANKFDIIKTYTDERDLEIIARYADNQRFVEFAGYNNSSYWYENAEEEASRDLNLDNTCIVIFKKGGEVQAIKLIGIDELP